jgi:hypothetical protein
VQVQPPIDVAHTVAIAAVEASAKCLAAVIIVKSYHYCVVCRYRLP